MEPFREIPPDTTVTVPAGARFVFQHYRACRKYVLEGGTITVRADGVESSGGARLSDTRVTCPRTIKLKDDGAPAGVVMRSIGPPPITISARPDFVIVGPRAGEISALRIRRGTEVIVDNLAATGRTFRWPQGTSPLAADTAYEVELLRAGAPRPAIVLGVRTGDSSATSEAVTLLNAE